MSKDELHYDNTHITFLEKLWGDGFMSPGGKQEIKKLLKGLNLKKQKILDIGCGSGGITVSLIDDYGAQKVIGVDVEKDVVKVARDRVSKNGLEDKIDILLIDKSRLPFDNDSFDIVLHFFLLFLLRCNPLFLLQFIIHFYLYLEFFTCFFVR